MKFSLVYGAAVWALVGFAGSVATAQSGPTEGIETIYGVAVDPAGRDVAGGRLLIATRYGLLRAAPDGTSTAVEGVSAAVAGLATSPRDANRLYLGGFDKDGNPIGVLTTADGGKSWAPVADGQDKVVASALSVSRTNPQRMISFAETIKLSNDGGATWAAVANTPEKTLDVAFSSRDDSRIFAATLSGLMQSDDGGQSWVKAFDGDAPVTTVASLSGNRIAAFVYGTGLIVATEPGLDWSVVADGFQDRYLRTLIEDPDNPGLLYGIVDTGAILLSRDSGRTWISFEGNDKATPRRIASGAQLFAQNCQTCHGVGGIGESPEDPGAKDEYGFKAPALNNDMHAWHHSDAGLRATIHQGSPRNQRMIPWQEVLSDAEIDDILAYLKSTWNVRSLACQGARHMRCMSN